MRWRPVGTVARAMVLVGVLLFVAGLGLALLPFDAESRRTGRSVACGTPLVAVGQVDAESALEGIGRLARAGAAPAAPPTAEALARVEALEGEVERFDACQRAAAWRMHVAGRVELVGAGLALFAVLRAARTAAPMAGARA